MMIHSFGDQRYAGHVTERGVKIFALELLVKFPGQQVPSGHAAEKLVDFIVCQFAGWHLHLLLLSPANHCVSLAALIKRVPTSSWASDIMNLQGRDAPASKRPKHLRSAH